MKNEGSLDRGVRIIAGEIFFLLAFFWLGEIWSLAFYILALIMTLTAIVGFCPLYAILKINTTKKNTDSNKKVFIIAIVLFVTILFGGAYASNFLSKKIFIEDFNAMNVFYKQTLFETGQEKRAESIKNYDLLLASYEKFQDKYSSYQPYAFRGDNQFEKDLNDIRTIIIEVDYDVRSENLKNAHLTLEKIRPITQEMFKRNGFSMLSITLVDFHDSMEKVLDKANVKDASGVISAYAEANDKLVAVELEANDDEIKAIRKNLEDILQLAKNGEVDNLPAKSAELKSSFVKVYLKRG